MNDGTPEYRFAPPGPRDEPRVVKWCEKCGDAIYAGDEVVRLNDGEIVCEACEIAYLRMMHVDKRGVIAADGTLE